MLTLTAMENDTTTPPTTRLTTDTRDEALARVVELVGGPAAVARLLRISSQAVSQWRRAPAERVLELERATVDPDTQLPRVTRHELRPDLYPAEESRLAAA